MVLIGVYGDMQLHQGNNLGHNERIWGSQRKNLGHTTKESGAHPGKNHPSLGHAPPQLF